MESGKFIVLYGVNNLGKTTQAKRLVAELQKSGRKAEYVKYPVYSLEPAGKYINGYLREGNPLSFSPRELQLLHLADRFKYDPILKEKLDSGITVVAEDYEGTSVCWGVGSGVEKELLLDFYSHVRREDLAFLLDGERFRQSIEENHKFEEDDDLMVKVREVHLEMANKFGWRVINANLTEDDIAEQLWTAIHEKLAVA